VSDYYKILGVDREADDEIIKAVYRKLALRYHPDVAPSASDAQRFLKIQEAYDVLSDPEKRRAYDASLAAKRRAGQGSRARRRSRTVGEGSGGRERGWDLRISLGGIDLLGLGVRVQKGSARNRTPPAKPSRARAQTPPATPRARSKALPPQKRPETQS
jgi:DnaJ-class molecular chaperone